MKLRCHVGGIHNMSKQSVKMWTSVTPCKG